MKKFLGAYQNNHMHWVGDGFPVYNLFSYDRLGQTLSPFFATRLCSALYILANE